MSAAVSEIKARAAEAFSGGDFRLALQLTREAQGVVARSKGGSEPVDNMEMARLRSNAAAALIELRDYESAVQEALEAIALAPGWGKPYLRHATARASQARLADAAAAIQRGLVACQAPEELEDLRSALAALTSLPDATPCPVRASSGGAAAAKRRRPASAADVAAPQHRALPVTALSGFLGAGKTTLVQHVLASLGAHAAGRVGLLVNDFAPFNVDAQLLRLAPLQQPQARHLQQQHHQEEEDAQRVPTTTTTTSTAAPTLGGGGGAAAAAPGELVELSNGCICCNKRGDMQQQLRRLLALQPPLEHVVVECTGVGEPEALAAGLAALAAEGVRVSRLVTVVDAASFLQLLLLRAGPNAEAAPPPLQQQEEQQEGHGGPAASVGDGGDRGARPAGPGPAMQPACGGLGPAGAREPPQAAAGPKPLAALLAQQVETADVILINKCDVLLERALQQQQQQQQQQMLLLQQARSEQPGQELPQRTGDEAALHSAARAAARQQLQRVVAAVRALNPTARVLPCEHCRVPLDVVLGDRCRGAVPDGGGGGCMAGSGGGLAPDAAAPAPGAGAAAGASGSALSAAAAGGSLAGGPGGGGGGGGGGPHDAALRASGAAGGAASLETEHGDGGGGGAAAANEEAEYGICSYVYRSRAPFHPARMWALLQALAAQGEQRPQLQLEQPQQHEQQQQQQADEQRGEAHAVAQAARLPHAVPRGLLRAKGLFWIASLPQAMWELSLAGGELQVSAAGRWLCSMVGREHWPTRRRTAAAAASPQGSSGQQQQQGEQGQEDGKAGGGAAATAAAAAEEEEDQGAESGVEWGASGAESGGDSDKAEEGSSSDAWHPCWGDRRCGLVFIGLAAGEQEGAAGGSEEGGAGAARSGAGFGEGLRALLRWARLTPEEARLGEAAWAAWDGDAEWLGLLERY